MNISIQNNLFAMNASGQYKLNTAKSVKTTEKLSSGYRINCAADDAAGLAISEKMRRQIRGLKQGTANAQEGLSWVQTGDGTLNEAHDILHRMTELSVKALNETYTDDDRELMQAEFDHLQSELDRLTDSSVFNEKHIFQDHETPYYQFEGNAVWLQDQRHIISDGANDLTVEYRLLESDPPVTRKITVPTGIYTTQALIDEIDTALENAGLIDEGIVFEYTEDGRCNLNLEGGEKIDNVSGGLSYLLYDSFGGGALGALIGTTTFPADDSRLDIAAGYNDQLFFKVVTTDGNAHDVELTILPGSYSRKELINLLQQELDTKPGKVQATEQGKGIKLASDESIITGFKGNMFQIDTGEFSYTSVFYDNVQESTVSFTPGVFTGAAILPTGSQYPQNQLFDIRPGVNDTLVLKPNGAQQETLITIPQGQYTMSEMITFLNTALNPLGLNASDYDNGNFQGITVQSAQTGVKSAVGFVQDKCTAYDTLFVRHEYKVPGRSATSANETNRDVAAELKSGSNYMEDGVSTLPLKIQADHNDKFRLTLNDATYTITLNPGEYDSLAAIKAALGDKLNGPSAPAGYKGLLTVEQTSNGEILLRGNHRSVNSISVSKADGNTGYEEIFVGQKQIHQWSQSGHTTATNNNHVLQKNGTVKITPSQNTMKVAISGHPQNITVTLPTGVQVTQQDIVNAINTQLGDTRVNNTFTGIDEPGREHNLHFTVPTDRSYTSHPGMPADFNATGTSKGDPQGIAGGYQVNTPAKSTISKALPESIRITGDNKHFECTLNGLGGSKEKKIYFDLSEKTYTRDELVSELQKQITAGCDNIAPDRYGGLEVKLDSANRLVFTAGLTGSNGAPARGSTTRFLSNPAANTFLKGLYEQKNPASIDLRNNNIPVDFGGGQTFTFQLKKPSDAAQQDVSVTLSGSYADGNALANHISDQLSAKGIPVRASFNGYHLTLTTTEDIDGYQLSFNSEKAGDAAGSMFGNPSHGYKLHYYSDVTADINCNVLDSFKIDAAHNEFRITINGTPRTAILPEGDYDLNRLVSELNQRLGDGVTVTPNGKKLRFTAEEQDGKQPRIQMQYGTGGSSMESIFGKRTVYGATASFKDGHLELTGNAPDGSGSVQVYSFPRNPFQLPDTQTSDPDDSTKGWYSDMHSYIQGAPVVLNENGRVTIDRWNKNLTLQYAPNYTGTSGISYTGKSIVLDEGEYTLKDLASALEAKLGSEFHVLEKDGGIRIEAARPGSTFRFQMLSYQRPYCSGGFYEQVLCSPNKRTEAGKAVDRPGGQTLQPAYVMGRKDIKNQTTNIQKGVNDDLGMEFTLGGKTYLLSMTLNPGSYSSDALLKHVQEKLDEALNQKGLPKGIIEAGIGGFNTGVAGANDENALHFILSTKVSLPPGSAGRCVIEAVSGTAAFSIFYQTEGDISRAYIAGTRDLGQGVEITDDNGELSVNVDGQNYAVQIPPKDDGGAYTPQELALKLNDLFKNHLTGVQKDPVPLSASIQDGRLQLMHTKFGQHTIGNISGSAKNSLFFTESGNKEEDSGIPIQLSSTRGDQIQVERPILNTASMRINSILISTTRYANKALKRLESANQRVSEVRAYFGSMHNRLVHAVNNNENKTENTTAAESAIRDADMSRELMAHIQQNLLQQAGMAMLAQANQTPQGVLRLLI